MKRRDNRPLVFAVAAAFALFFFLTATPAPCAAPVNTDPEAYRYNPEGKPDPFKPFIRVAEEGTKAAPLHPLRRFAVGEFHLTGIVRTVDRKIAIVKAPDGKRYTIRRGTPLGINGGRVAQIGPDSVVVVEKIESVSGTVRSERVILALKKGGGNP